MDDVDVANVGFRREVDDVPVNISNETFKREVDNVDIANEAF